MTKQSNFKLAGEPATETPTTAIAVTTETHEVSLVLPDGLDLNALMAQTDALEGAQISMATKAKYLEMVNVGDTFRCIFLGFGTTKHQSNDGSGELVEKKCVKLLGSDRSAYVNSSTLLVREFEQATLNSGTPVQITYQGQKVMPNGFKAKVFDIHLLA